MPLLDFLLGRPLASREEKEEKIGIAAGIPIFGLDALGSAAYGPEAALTVLLPLGAAGLSAIVPIGFSIVALLTIVCFSYLQTIPEYPQGGGAYTVATRNLGVFWGLLAGAALMIDYVLTAAVGISAGVGAMVSAVPSWQPYTLQACIVILVLVTLVNLRGVRESSSAFMVPTYLFVACLLGAIAWGVWKSILAGGHPTPAVSLHRFGPAQQAASLWLLLRAFSSGCTAMTGVEAVSNGVSAFREPRTRTAQGTLIVIVSILTLMLVGIAWLSRAYGIGATVAGQRGYESVLSQLVAAVAGRGAFYYVTIGAILLVLALQANTAFAGFPRLCSVIAQDGFLPRFLSNRGRRLVHSAGIVVLALLAGALLVFFGGVTDRLIPLFAIGAFLAFTLSQAGMVGHWRRSDASHARKSAVVNAVGALCTGATLLIVIVSKFKEGAWITLLAIPAILALMRGIHRHRARVERKLASRTPLPVENLSPPLAVVPIQTWDRASQGALRFALSISRRVLALHVQTEGDNAQLEQRWADWVGSPARALGIEPPELIVLRSPYRFVVKPLVDYVLELEKKYPNQQVTVVVPTLVERRWYQRFLHTQRSELLTALLLLNGQRHLSIVNVPWYADV